MRPAMAEPTVLMVMIMVAVRVGVWIRTHIKTPIR